MLFNSWIFALFFLLVFPTYWLLSHKKQNRFLLLASYLFYGWWDWRFLSLLILTTTVDYAVSLFISKSDNSKTRKRFLFLSLFLNLLVLGVFKYFNFFSASFDNFASLFGFHFNSFFLNVILPVGISFYTFQSMSYVIDVYRKTIKAEENFFDFALFVAFFPQLVAGPIERAGHLLNQIKNQRIFKRENFFEGAFLVYWGLFEKIFIADNLAKIANSAFEVQSVYSGLPSLIGMYAFAFQIYCDFDGYSNIARGLAKMMGFDLMVNFNFPYFSKNISEFWRRWHISLSTWIRDYIYIPLGGSRKGKLRTYVNLIAAMGLAGLWHGANWTFIAWGLYHGLLLALHRLYLNSKKQFWRINRFTSFIKMIVVFNLVCAGFILFRAVDFSQALKMIVSIFNNFQFVRSDLPALIIFSCLIIIVVSFNSYQYLKGGNSSIMKMRPIARYLVYFIMFYLMILFASPVERDFIYFKF